MTKKLKWYKKISVGLLILVFALQISNFRYNDIDGLRTKSLVEVREHCQKKNNLKYPRDIGTILVTKDNLAGFIPFVGHAGIVLNSQQVIQSASLDGVYYGPNDWDTSKITCYAAIPRETDRREFVKAANWAQNQINRKYNFNFLNWRNPKLKKFYCSQLVWAAYYNACGIDLAPKKHIILLPMDLLSDDSVTDIIYFNDDNDQYEKT